jgi:hypothetical protein
VGGGGGQGFIFKWGIARLDLPYSKSTLFQQFLCIFGIRVTFHGKSIKVYNM